MGPKGWPKQVKQFDDANPIPEPDWLLMTPLEYEEYCRPMRASYAHWEGLKAQALPMQASHAHRESLKAQAPEVEAPKEEEEEHHEKKSHAKKSHKGK